MIRIGSRAIAFASSAAFVLVLASVVASADGIGIDSDQDGVSDNLEDRTERTVAAIATGDQFNVSSHLGTDGVEDQFEFWYWPGHFGVWYGVEGGASVSYRLELRSLVEWSDQDGDNQIGSAEIMQVTPLGSAAFDGSIVDRTIQRGADGGRVFTFTVDSVDGQVTLVVKIAQRFTRLGDVTLTPMEARMEIRINRLLSDPSWRVGLELRLDADNDDQVQFEDHSWDELKEWAPSERAVSMTRTEDDHSASAFFSWSNGAVVSAQSGTVTHTSEPLGFNDHTLYFAYPAGSPQAAVDVVHQTAFGVRSAAFDARESVMAAPPPVQGDPIVFTITFAAVAALVGLTIFLSNRRRAQVGEENRKP